MEIDKNTRTIRGKNYRPTIFKVLTSDGEGPRTFELVRDDEVVHLEGGEQFWIVYALEDVLRRRS